ncbi:Flp pilus assembly protein pilin Flp [Cupriavidus necator]|uniref:Flp pilus assembly protein pilin Flp n=1 Tax=Cupriavidus necator TaxID=106590 RepID=A0A1K0IS97_CUPNE|nr:Flp pilus assembly protein pilin Flp [Cupriavidus necator]
MSTINAHLKRFLRDERGVTSIEYALLGALLAMAIVSGVSALGNAVGSLYKTIATKVSSLPSLP